MIGITPFIIQVCVWHYRNGTVAELLCGV